ncbi:superfamily II DNA or RNA helicase [Delftia acidovorans]|uniref:DEAD/DEAH box helicase n=1 Tax=Delftia acidovorans TaxID=80866 RepID=UPI000F99B7C5|nr:DEAD/DEAH box helicase family protein [Delftia acidovorans]ROR02456.1 superfamily II DNA or RNA helicase [Delftia acidovorans]
MARLSINSEPVQTLITGKVIPLLLASGNVASLTKALNDAAQSAGLDGRLHANRIHALLSMDASRALNEASIALIDQACDAMLAADGNATNRAAAAMQELSAETSKLAAFSTLTATEIAERLSIPPALAQQLLSAKGTGETSTTSSQSLAPQHETEGAAPDWSYQDIAVSRCLDALNRRPGGRIGLILPTGAGKTRTALRIVLAMLDRAADHKAPVYWVTHRRNLREQAHRELQKLIASTSSDQGETLSELGNRIKFVMVGDLSPLLNGASNSPVLIVVDEAHHAAAPSYQPVFANSWMAPVLLLTATPNRGDRLPIGIDEIAFTITYRELAERRAILTPKFVDFPVDNFDWSPDALDDLVDFIIDRTAADFTKVLVLAPRVDRVEEFYAALAARLPNDHPLTAEDLGFVHGSGNSLAIDNEDFLARFANKPRAVLVSAQLLLEGFDDPAINAVVLTYPSSSVIRLMQAAGRCVRYSPEKRAAFVVQARNDGLAYHFDQRWLYQEIDDFLRPQLIDIDYGSHAELLAKVEDILDKHRVETKQADRIKLRLNSVVPGETYRLFLYGLPHFGEIDRFEQDAKWGILAETPETSHTLRGIFNEFCARGADLSDPSDFLISEGSKFGLIKDLTPGSRWLEMSHLLTAAYFAKREVHGPSAIDAVGKRPYKANGATSWLKYITLHFRPAIPQALVAFLKDCHNAQEIEAQYLRAPLHAAAAIKVPLPLAGSEAHLLNEAESKALVGMLDALRLELTQVEPRAQFGTLAAYLMSTGATPLPARLHHRIEFLLDPVARHGRMLTLNHDTPVSFI